MSPNNIELEISKIKNLPPLPEESIKIITAINDPDITVEALVDVLSFSPVLVARLLGLANSAFFGRAGKINDLRIAIIQVLGLNLVKSLVLSIVLNVELNTSKCKNFDPEFFWGHALVTALLAQKLSKDLEGELMQPNIIYTSGLLLNIGLLASIFIFPSELNDVFSKSDPVEGSVFDELNSVVGKSQYEIGGILLERWKLPPVYQNIVKQFRQSAFQGEERHVIELLELSHWVAAYIVTDKVDQLPDFSDTLAQLSIPKSTFIQVVDDTFKNKDNIQELASVISG